MTLWQHLISILCRQAFRYTYQRVLNLSVGVDPQNLLGLLGQQVLLRRAQLSSADILLACGFLALQQLQASCADLGVRRSTTIKLKYLDPVYNVQ